MPDQNDERPVQALLSEIEKAWNAGDLKAYAALYSNDAGYITRAGILLTGRSEIEQQHARALAGSLSGTRLQLTCRRTRFLAPGVAVVHVDVELIQPAGTTQAITTFVLAQEDEGWRIRAAHTTEVTSATA
jgi:uncharacterized protein (TIGR02246 family)